SLQAPLDHANPNNPNDVITLTFGVTATDSDGDVTAGRIVVDVLDDAPIARNDIGGLSGNVTSNDTLGADTATVTSV
ncbi:hypothetical protein NL463_31070, partial [Klebsiella pneumoniae]|nr:hypothetical protein [Klebsiella pneumoniae]